MKKKKKLYAFGDYAKKKKKKKKKKVYGFPPGPERTTNILYIIIYIYREREKVTVDSPRRLASITPRKCYSIGASEGEFYIDGFVLRQFI